LLHCCCSQVFRDAGWDGKTPPLPSSDRKKHHKHHSKDSNTAKSAATAAAELGEALESSFEEFLVQEDRESYHEDDGEAEAEVPGAQEPAAAAAGSAAEGAAMPSLQEVQLARAAVMRQQQQHLSVQGEGLMKPWWQQQRSMQLQRLRGAGHPAQVPAVS
jgi:hypothetical protein